MKPVIAMFVIRGGTVLGAGDYAGILARLRTFCALVTDAVGSDWTETAYGTYNGNALYVELTHGDGAQMFFNVGPFLDAANMEIVTAAVQRLLISFKPSQSGGTFATVTDTVNPVDTSTYCADAGAFLFQWLRSSTGGVDDAFIAADIFFRMVIDTESAYMWFTSTEDDNTTVKEMIIHADDAAGAPNFVSLEPGDTYKAFTIWGDGVIVQSGTERGQFRDSSGVHQSGPVFSTREGNLNWATDLWRTGISLVRVELTHPTAGRKGIIDQRVYCRVRSDVYGRQLFHVPGTDYRMLHWDAGRCFPWPTDQPVMW